MTAIESNPLARECQVFADYLTSVTPDAYVLEKYREAHRKAQSYIPSGPFDQFLLNFATTSTSLTALADSYACLLARGSSLRKKLILLLAILESCPPTHGFVDSVDGHGQPLLYLMILQRGVLFVLRFLLAVVVLLPFHVALGLAGRILKGNR